MKKVVSMCCGYTKQQLPAQAALHCPALKRKHVKRLMLESTVRAVMGRQGVAFSLKLETS